MRTLMIPLLLVAAPAIADSPNSQPATIQVTSSAFDDGGDIPGEFTCQGSNVSPPLRWSTVPAGTKSVAIMMDDPDAPKGGFLHWMVTSLPPTTHSLDGGATLPPGAVASKNGKGQTGYTGPCPPSGTHHYRFRVYALDRTLPRAPTSRADFAPMVRGHLLASGELVGTYTMK